jgi:hypothetical protein
LLNKAFNEHVAREETWQQSVIDKLDAIINTKINGFDPLPGEVPLHTTLRGLYETQKSQRINSLFWKSFHEWRDNKPMFQVFKSRIGRWLVFLLLFLIANSILHPYGMSFSVQSLLQAIKVIP